MRNESSRPRKFVDFLIGHLTTVVRVGPRGDNFDLLYLVPWEFLVAAMNSERVQSGGRISLPFDIVQLSMVQ